MSLEKINSFCTQMAENGYTVTSVGLDHESFLGLICDVRSDLISSSDLPGHKMSFHSQIGPVEVFSDKKHQLTKLRQSLAEIQDRIRKLELSDNDDRPMAYRT